MAAIAKTSSTINDSVRLTQQALIRLRQHARHLSLDALRVRARKGGNYLSHFKGRGMEFDEARLYQDGDDPRSIDWRVTARTGRAYTKLFREERERPVIAWVDMRAGMYFATRGALKSVQAGRLASLLGWAAVQRGDRFGGFVFNDSQQADMRPMLGNRAVLRFIHQLVRMQPVRYGDSESIALDRQLTALRRVVHPGSLVALFSDFRGFDEAARIHLVDIARHNDVLMLSLVDPLEQALPGAGQYPVIVGNERLTIDAGSGARERWQARYRERQDALATFCQRNQIRWAEVSTAAAPLAVMQQLMGRAR